MTSAAAALLAAITVGTWNGEWFPSGRAEHRAAPEIEAATVKAAARMIREGLDAADPAGTNDIILCLNEMRGPKVARELCAEIGRSNLNVAVISAYRRRDRFDMQQDVIATTLPVADAGWSRWKNAKADTPPRGYVTAKIVFSPTVTATVYAVHLKSNYGQTTDDLVRRNRRKRTLAIDQLMEQERRPKRKRKGSPPTPVIIAGDFNADKWSPSFSEETIFKSLEQAGFVNTTEALPPDKRATHPGRGKWHNSALDYIMIRDAKMDGLPCTVSAEGISDHNPVFVNIEN